MLGTIVNTATIVTGTIIGHIAKKGIKEKYQQDGSFFEGDDRLFQSKRVSYKFTHDLLWEFCLVR